MNPLTRSNPIVATLLALCAVAGLGNAANAASIGFQFTDEKNSATMVSSAASLTLTDFSDATLGSGVMFSLHATLDNSLLAGGKIADIAFNGPAGGFNNLSGAAYAAYRGDVLIDTLSHTGDDGALVNGIRFNWSDNGNSFDVSNANAFTNGKTSNWFIGGATVSAFDAAPYLNPFAILHVNGAANGMSMWLLDGTEPQRAGTVAEPQMALLLATGLCLVGWTRRRRGAAVRARSVVK